MPVVAVDVSKASLELALEGSKAKRGKSKSCYERQVDNETKGFERLLSWAQERTGSSAKDLTVVMEATGVYHEAAALWLHEAGCRVIIANPKRARDYAKGIGMLNKADRVDARALLRYGCEKAEELQAWEPPSAEIRTLRALYARLSAVQTDLRRELNRKEQADLSGQPQAVSESMQQSIEHLQADCKRLEQAIEDHFDEHPGLREQRELLQSIVGVGPVSGDLMLCLLKRHEFRSARQAAAFAGLAPTVHESGTSVRKASHLPNHGEGGLKKVLYWAAVSASRYNKELRSHYQALLIAGKTKMCALGVLMRRLLHIAFGILKSGKPYDPQLVAPKA
jgi:transposase